MKVHYKELATFRVESDKGQTSYEVNLLYRRPHGWCDCPDYTFRKKKAQNDKRKPVWCKHIQAARQHFVEMVLDKLVEQRKAAAGRGSFEGQAGETPHPGAAEVGTDQEPP